MVAKRDVETLMSRYLGKATADAMLKKVDNMAREGATVAKIEEAIAVDLASHIETDVAGAVKATIGRHDEPTRSIQVSIRPRIKEITIGPKMSSGIQTRVGPGHTKKGAK
jgi:hypothetical protein